MKKEKNGKRELTNKCKCGCGKVIDEDRIYVQGHNNKGKTYEQIYGLERAKEIKKRRSHPDVKKNKTYEEYYGIDKSSKIREKSSKAQKGKPKPKVSEGLKKFYKTPEGIERKLVMSLELKNRLSNKCPAFIDGRTSIQMSLYKIAEAKQWRQKVFDRDHNICQECGKNTGSMVVHHCKLSLDDLLSDFLKHHKKYDPIKDKSALIKLARSWEPFWDIGNGLTLCQKCHGNIESLNRRGDNDE